jgi:hypothetical protein
VFWWIVRLPFETSVKFGDGPGAAFGIKPAQDGVDLFLKAVASLFRQW